MDNDKTQAAHRNTVEQLVRNQDDNRHRCAVRGMPRPGVMCGAVIVGGEFCGHSGECPHKVIPNARLDRQEEARP